MLCRLTLNKIDTTQKIMDSKNIARSTFKEFNLENCFVLLELNNDSNTTQLFEREIDNSFIQIHFCIHGNSKFLFNEGNYSFEGIENHALLLYNPQQELPLNLQMEPEGKVVSLLISIEKFHALFSSEAAYIPFLSDNNKNKKYYDDAIIKPSVALVLKQILNANISESVKKLYLKGKIYELLSLHFQKDEALAGEYCPYLVNEGDVSKIRQAKDIIIARMVEPPTLQELSNEIGLNLKKLKEGFKQVYGDTVYSFLFDYKMEYAKKLLEKNQHNVNEVGLQIGYSTASHFIAAFKKKYGTTPKQYVLSLS